MTKDILACSIVFGLLLFPLDVINFLSDLCMCEYQNGEKNSEGFKIKGKKAEKSIREPRTFSKKVFFWAVNSTKTKSTFPTRGDK